MLEGEGLQPVNLTVDGWMGKHDLAISVFYLVFLSFNNNENRL